MMKGSILVVTLVIVIFLSLTVIMMLTLYSQLVNNYTMQQKRLLVSNVAKSGAYVLAHYYLNGRLSLTTGNLQASLPQFGGQILYRIEQDIYGYIIRCTAKLDEKVSDTFSLRIGWLPFVAALTALSEADIDSSGSITGDIIAGNLDITKVDIVGNVYADSISIGNPPATISGNIFSFLPDWLTILASPSYIEPPQNLPFRQLSNDTINESGNYGSIEFKKKSTLTFDASQRDILVQVKKISAENNLTIKVIGPYTVAVYFEEGIVAKNDFEITFENGGNIIFYSDKVTNLEFKNNFKAETDGGVYFLAPKATMTVKNNLTLEGSIVVNNLRPETQKMNSMIVKYRSLTSSFLNSIVDQVHYYRRWGS